MIKKLKIPHTSILIVSDWEKIHSNLFNAYIPENWNDISIEEKTKTFDKMSARMNRDKDFEIVSADYTIDGNCSIEELYKRVCLVIDGKE